MGVQFLPLEHLHVRVRQLVEIGKPSLLLPVFQLLFFSTLLLGFPQLRHLLPQHRIEAAFIEIALLIVATLVTKKAILAGPSHESD